VRKLHESIKKIETTAVEEARQLGEHLYEAKRLCRHGGWLEFLESCGIGKRRAEECMRIAERWSEIEENAHGRAHLLTISLTRTLLSKKRSNGLGGGSGTRTSVEADDQENTPAKPARPAKTARFPNPEPAVEAPDVVPPESEEGPLPEMAPRPVAARPIDHPEAEWAVAGMTTMAADRDRDLEAWLRSLPARSGLKDPAHFDAAALLWRRIEPTLCELRRLVAPHESELARGSSASLAAANFRLRMIFAACLRPPAEWVLCSRCNGESTDRFARIPCPCCGGGGFQVAHDGDFTEEQRAGTDAA
jgi:hypothetical protein